MHSVGPGWDRATLAKTFATPETAMHWLGSVDYATFKDNLAWLNGGLQGLPPDERGFEEHMGSAILTRPSPAGDGKDVMYMAPHPRSYDTLLSEAHLAAAEMPDPVEAGKLLSTVVVETQPFSDAHKRLARRIYGLATHGYDGSREADEAAKASDAAQNPATAIHFGRLHDRLSGVYVQTIAPQFIREGQKSVRGYIDLPADAPVPAGLTPDVAMVAGYYLREPHFGPGLALAWIYATGRPLERYQDEQGAIRLQAVYDELTPESFGGLVALDRGIKEGYVTAIINGFARHTGPLRFASELTQDCWPPATPMPSAPPEV